MIRSIRVTLTFWYVGILTTILCLFGWTLYTNVAANVTRDIDQLLASQADGVADSIFAFWQAGRDVGHRPNVSSAVTFPGLSGEIQKEIESGKFSLLIAQWAQEVSQFEASRPLQVLDQKREPLFSTPAFLELHLSFPEIALSEAKRGRTVYATFNLSDHRIRMVSRPIIENGRILYFVEVVLSLHHSDASLARLKLWLFWLIPLTLVITSAGGWFLATVALKPVGRMITQAQRIGVGQLHERIDIPRTGDELEHLASTFNDMLARLERTFKRMRQFSAAASHELRTPLTIMKGELEVALRSTRDVGEYQRVLRAQLEALNEMADIVEQLLMLARSEEGEGAVEWRPVKLDALVKEAVQLWGKVAREKGIQLDLFTPHSVWVLGEERLLGRLVANLLDNALKHTPPKGRVLIQTEQRMNEVFLTVQDTGPGISPEELPKIFDKFFTKSSDAAGSDSIGLGLGLCRWIVEAHQGRIEVSSSPGAGATFTAWFPIKNL